MRRASTFFRELLVFRKFCCGIGSLHRFTTSRLVEITWWEIRETLLKRNQPSKIPIEKCTGFARKESWTFEAPKYFHGPKQNSLERIYVVRVLKRNETHWLLECWFGRHQLFTEPNGEVAVQPSLHDGSNKVFGAAISFKQRAQHELQSDSAESTLYFQLYGDTSEVWLDSRWIALVYDGFTIWVFLHPSGSSWNNYGEKRGTAKL